MTTFTIDAENTSPLFPAPDQAEAAVGAGAQPFTSEQELAGLAATWPAERLVAVWNSLPGVKPVKGFKNGAAAASRIWERIQGLGAPEPQPEFASASPLRGSLGLVCCCRRRSFNHFPRPFGFHRGGDGSGTSR